MHLSEGDEATGVLAGGLRCLAMGGDGEDAGCWVLGAGEDAVYVLGDLSFAVVANEVLGDDDTDDEDAD